MALHISAGDLEVGTVQVDTEQGGLSTKSVHGRDSSVQVCSRLPGYHSTPHKHDCEQFTYIVSGRTWMFIEHEGFQAGPGDFFRVPRNAVHWSWNLGGEDLVTVQTFSPAMDPSTVANSVGLFAEGESDEVRDPAPNVTVENAAEYRAGEREIMGAAYPAESA
jgi:mannose-6-phosphate isomerase-like protein (cupin superfamily)